MTVLAGIRHPSRAVDVPAELFVRGRVIGDCWIRYLSDGPGLFVLRCRCGWATAVPQGAERHLTEALGRWRAHAQERTAVTSA